MSLNPVRLRQKDPTLINGARPAPAAKTTRVTSRCQSIATRNCGESAVTCLNACVVEPGCGPASEDVAAGPSCHGPAGPGERPELCYSGRWAGRQSLPKVDRAGQTATRRRSTSTATDTPRQTRHGAAELGPLGVEPPADPGTDVRKGHREDRQQDPDRHLLEEQGAERLGAAVLVQRLYADHGRWATAGRRCAGRSRRRRRPRATAHRAGRCRW